MKEGEEGAESTAEKDDIVAVVDRAGKGAFVGIEGGENGVEQCGRGCGRGRGCFEIAIEFKELREKGKNESE